MSLLDQVAGLEAALLDERDCSTVARLGAALRRSVSRAAQHMDGRHIVRELIAHTVGVSVHMGISKHVLLDAIGRAYEEVAG